MIKEKHNTNNNLQRYRCTDFNVITLFIKKLIQNVFENSHFELISTQSNDIKVQRYSLYLLC